MQEYGLFQVSNACHRADLKLGPFDFMTPYFTRSLVSFPVTPPLPRRLLARPLPCKWVWPHTSISAYPLLSAYFLTTYRYKRMRLIIRVYGN